MQDLLYFLLLPLLVMTGCATPPPLACTPATAPPIVRADSDLSDLQKAAHKENKEQKKERKTEARCSTCNSSPCTCDSAGGQFTAQLLLRGLKAPFTFQAWMLNDDYEHITKLPDYPYYNGIPGSLLIESEYDGAPQTWTGNLQLATVQGAHGVDRYGGRLLLESDSRWGLDTESNFWTQKQASGGTNQLWTGDANLVYRFAESECVQVRGGVGVNWLADQTRPEAGVNFTYGVDIFPSRPWTLSTVFDVGTLGGGGLFHNRTTAGVMLGPVEAFAGYDYFELGSARFHGPVAGVGYRF